MKKIVLAGGLLLGLLSAQAQESAGSGSEKSNTYEISVKGLANSTWLFNSNISGMGNEQDYDMAWGFNYGAGFTAYFGSIGVGVEAIMGNHAAAYQGTYELKDTAGPVVTTYYSVDYKSHVNLSTMEIPVFFKLRSASGGAYLEVGPSYNIVTKATYTSTGEPTTDLMAAPYGGSFATTKDVTDKYANNYIAAIIGFGLKFRISDSPVTITTGLRLRYGFTDLKGVDGVGRDMATGYDAVGRSWNSTLLGDLGFRKYDSPAASNAASGGLMLGVTYDLGKKK